MPLAGIEVRVTVVASRSTTWQFDKTVGLPSCKVPGADRFTQAVTPWTTQSFGTEILTLP